MRADFSQDAGISQVVIGSDTAIAISSIAGPEIKEILITGDNKALDDLCVFTQPTVLPKLERVVIENAEILDFGYHQMQNCLQIRSV